MPLVDDACNDTGSKPADVDNVKLLNTKSAEDEIMPPDNLVNKLKFYELHNTDNELECL